MDQLNDFPIAKAFSHNSYKHSNVIEYSADEFVLIKKRDLIDVQSCIDNISIDSLSLLSVNHEDPVTQPPALQYRYESVDKSAKESDIIDVTEYSYDEFQRLQKRVFVELERSMEEIHKRVKIICSEMNIIPNLIRNDFPATFSPIKNGLTNDIPTTAFASLLVDHKNLDEGPEAQHTALKCHNELVHNSDKNSDMTDVTEKYFDAFKRVKKRDLVDLERSVQDTFDRVKLFKRLCQKM